MRWKGPPVSQLQQEKHTLQMKLLKVNAELRLQVLYREKLEMLLRHRQETIDELNGKLEAARTANHQLEQECDRWAKLYATNGAGHSMTSTL